MSSYEKLRVKRYPKTRTENAETRYFRKFKPRVHNLVQPVLDLEFSPVHPWGFVATSAMKATVIDPETMQVTKTINRYKSKSLCCSFRSDGKVLASGTEKGIVKLFDVSSRIVMRTFRNHKSAVHKVKFSKDMQAVISCSDDKTIRMFDVPGEQQLSMLTGHTDYVRAGCLSTLSDTGFVSASYDHTIKLWDMRSNECVLTMDHEFPVEDVLMMNTSGQIISAGSNKVCIWDVISGGKLLNSFSNHQKTVTSLSLDRTGTRLFSGGLDQMVKVYDTVDWKVTHTFKYDAPVLSLAFSPVSDHLAVGQTNGHVVVRSRVEKDAEEEIDAWFFEGEVKTDKTPRPGTRKYFNRGNKNQGSDADYKVHIAKKKHLRKYDKFLREFQYHKALDVAMESNHSVVVVTVLEELIRRKGLDIALAGRDEHSLEPIFRFLLTHITNAYYSMLLVDVTNALLDLYSNILGVSPAIDELFLKLKDKVREECELQNNMASVSGVLELVMSSAALQQPVVQHTTKKRRT